MVFFFTEDRRLAMNPPFLETQRVAIDHGLFYALTALEGFQFWAKLGHQHGLLFLKEFDEEEQGCLIPVCRHSWSSVDPVDHYYRYHVCFDLSFWDFFP
jgi:hypothetical protein